MNGAINGESGLHFQLVTNEPKAFDSLMARYGKFSGVTNYIALAGKKSKDLDELCGYYGERLVLLVPTAMNQQKFHFSLENGRVLAKAGAGFYAKIDLGIVKYHFETAAGKENFRW